MVSPLIPQLALLLAGCERPTEVVEGPPDLVLLLSPGLRADPPHKEGAEAAFLEAFAGQPQRRFTAAYVQSTSAHASLGSLLTGRYPSSIPLCGRVGFGTLVQAPAEQPWCTELPADLPTLPAVLGLYGYRSAVFSSGMDGVEALSAGFDTVEELSGAAQDRRTEWARLGAQVETWWEADGQQPRLLVVLLSDLELQHRPDLRAALGLTPAPSGPELPPLVAGRPGSRDEATAGLPREGPAPPVPDEDLEGPSYPWTTLDHRLVQATYEQAAAAQGRELAGLLDGLTPAPHRSRLVVLSSTRGASLGELSGVRPFPRAFAWADILLDRTMRVPLVILGAGQERTFFQPIEILDLLPTLLARGGATPPAGLPGEDLLALSDEDPLATAYGEHGDMLALRRGPWLFTLRAMIHQGTSLDPQLTERLQAPGVDDHYHLHQVLEDPWQHRDLRSVQPALCDELKLLLLQLRTGPGAPPADEEVQRRLQQLRLTASDGYW